MDDERRVTLLLYAAKASPALGAFAGLALGFFHAGVGGAILGALVFACLGPVLVFLLEELWDEISMLLAFWVALAFLAAFAWLIDSLWDVGKFW
ncbi:MAG: hypothetical protein K0U98_11495 [Deltaproteobacteria bacterium]|nr:hypothetical protein [Deltaproteobacteria bacterium]